METKFLTTIIFIVVGVIAAFAIIAGFSNSIWDAASSAAYPTNDCDTSVSSFNARTLSCINSSNGADLGAATISDQLPLSGFFSPSGIAVIFLLIAILVIVAIYLLKAFKG